MFAIAKENELIKYPADPFLENPNVSFTLNWSGGFIAGNTYVMVEETDLPTPNRYEKIVEDVPKLISDVWVQQWKSVNMSNEEVYEYRNSLTCSKFQFKSAVYLNDMIEEFERFFLDDSIVDPIIKIYWQETETIQRNTNFIKELSKILNMTEERMDDLFEYAVKIKP
jgi:hypothetical protein